VKPSPTRWKLIDKQRELNRLLAARCEADGKARLVDLGSALVGPDGQPREELFRADRLHLNEQGYAAWSTVLAPLLGKP
jgi:lysophospholipase L1-like esterase